MNIDSDVVRLIDKYLKMNVKFEDQIHRNSKGVIQGSSLGPLFSNLFVNKLDHQMQDENVAYVRFSDDIKIFSSDLETAVSFKYKISRKKIR